MKRSLDYFTAQLQPVPVPAAPHPRVPGLRTFAQSFANTIPYSESIGFIASYDDPEKIDLVTYVTAHEIGHQWWAHQVMSGETAGHDGARRDARPVLGADGDGAAVRAGPDPQVPEVRARPLSAQPRRRADRGAAARAGREPAVHPLPEGLARDVPAEGHRRRGRRQPRAARAARRVRVQGALRIRPPATSCVICAPRPGPSISS